MTLRASRMWVTPLDDTGQPTGERREIIGFVGGTIDHRPFPGIDDGPIDLDLTPLVDAWHAITDAMVAACSAMVGFAAAVATRYAVERLDITEADIRRATLDTVTLWNGRRIPIGTHQVLAWARGEQP